MTIVNKSSSGYFDLEIKDGSAFGKICGLSGECFKLVEQENEDAEAGFKTNIG